MRFISICGVFILIVLIHILYKKEHKIKMLESAKKDTVYVPSKVPSKQIYSLKRDTVFITANKTTEVKKQDSSLFYKKRFDSLKKSTDSLKTKLFLANYKVEKVKFYIKIVERNSSQKVFFYGWIRRAVK